MINLKTASCRKSVTTSPVERHRFEWLRTRYDGRKPIRQAARPADPAWGVETDNEVRGAGGGDHTSLKDGGPAPRSDPAREFRSRRGVWIRAVWPLAALLLAGTALFNAMSTALGDPVIDLMLVLFAVLAIITLCFPSPARRMARHAQTSWRR